jgi:hypothetical protein
MTPAECERALRRPRCRRGEPRGHLGMERAGGGIVDTQRSVGSGPPARGVPRMVYDPVRRVTVLFGGGRVGVPRGHVGMERNGLGPGPGRRPFRSNLPLHGLRRRSGRRERGRGGALRGTTRWATAGELWQYNGVEWRLRSSTGRRRPAARRWTTTRFASGSCSSAAMARGTWGRSGRCRCRPIDHATAGWRSGLAGADGLAHGRGRRAASYRWRRDHQFLVDDGRVIGARRRR